MLPKFTALFEGHRWLCLNRRVRYTERDLFDAQIAIARARLLAVALAPREEDEPAALLSRSCSRRMRCAVRETRSLCSPFGAS